MNDLISKSEIRNVIHLMIGYFSMIVGFFLIFFISDIIFKNLDFAISNIKSSVRKPILIGGLFFYIDFVYQIMDVIFGKKRLDWLNFLVSLTFGITSLIISHISVKELKMLLFVATVGGITASIAHKIAKR